MDAIVEKLIEIEETAKSIVKHAEDQKYSVDKKLQDERNIFDERQETNTKQKIEEIRAQSDKTMERLLEEQRIKNQSTIDSLVADFEQNHTAYAMNVVKRIIEV